MDIDVPEWVLRCAFIAYMPIFVPCFVALKVVEKTVKWGRRKAVLPKSLPRKRRALSISKDEGVIRSMGLLGRLPYELRHMVYVYAVGDCTLHITHVPAQRRMGHTNDHRYDDDVSYQSPHHPCNGKVALLRTCRQIYIEASHILYATNTFSVIAGLYRNGDYPNTKAFSYFFPTIRPERLATISSIAIECWSSEMVSMRHACDSKHWRFLCNTMATRMPGLKQLKIQLMYVLTEDLPWTMEAEWIKQLLLVSGLQSFGLQVELDGASRRTRDFYNHLKELERRLEEKLCSRS